MNTDLHKMHIYSTEVQLNKRNQFKNITHLLTVGLTHPIIIQMCVYFTDTLKN